MGTRTIVTCDMCGREASFESKGTTGWLTVQQRGEPDPGARLWIFGDLTRVAEVCSWECLAKYVAARASVEGPAV